ncbi:MAG: hypothetical protein PWP32_826, partial [Methanothermobacter sp.]|nr:hypothetical protein [Methanothermobacter sp.]
MYKFIVENGVTDIKKKKSGGLFSCSAPEESEGHKTSGNK